MGRTDINEILYSGIVTWASGTVALSGISNIDITLPTNPQPDSIYMIAVYNPSAVSDVNADVKNTVSFSGVTDYGALTSYTVPKTGAGLPTTHCRLVQGWFLGNGARLTLTNVTTLSAGAVTLHVKVVKL